MFRASLTIVGVAFISAGLAQLRGTPSQRLALADSQQIAWVRTIDGWEPSSVLTLGPPPQGRPPLHPALVASLQLGVSLFALIALPTANLAIRKS